MRKLAILVGAVALGGAQAASLAQQWQNLASNHPQLLAREARIQAASAQAQAARGQMGPTARLEGSWQSLDAPLVLDLDPIRQALIAGQSADQAQFAALAAQLKGQSLSPAQSAAVQAAAQNAYAQALPAFRDTVKEQHQWTAALTLSQPLYAGGRLHTAWQLAKQQHTMDLSEKRKTLADLHLASGRIYIQGTLLRAQIRAREQGLAALKLQVHNTQLLVQQGLADSRALLQARLRLAEGEADLAGDQDRLRGLEYILADLCGPSSTPWDSLPPAPSAALDSNPQPGPATQWAQAQWTLARSAQDLRDGEAWPEIAAFGRYELHPQALSALEPKWVLGIRAGWTLHASDAPTRQAARAKVREAEWSLKAVQNQTEAQSQRWIQNAQAAQKRAQTGALRDSLGLENYRITSQKYSQGMATQNEVLEAWSTWQKADLDRLAATAEVWTARLEYAALRGSEEQFLQTWKEAHNAHP